MKKQWIIIILLVIILLSMVACTTYNPLSNDLYTKNVYPSTTNTYDIGSAVLQYDKVYTGELYLNGVLFGGVSSQWVDDANGIEYTSGSVGINTPSVATSLVKIYSNSGTKSQPVLSVSDNTASAGANVIYAGTVGAKTDHTTTIQVDNYATSGSAGKNKYGVRITSGSVWNGAGSTNYGLYIDTPIGGINNVAAFIDGTTDLSDNELNNVSLLNYTDPTELTINAGAITVTQSFHTVDTESDAPIDDLVTINGGSIGDTLTLS
ncbi:MAG: hypothetical protein WC364_15440, partial [Eubacteriales bacterium]